MTETEVVTKPTMGALRRFRRLPSMLPAKIAFPVPLEGGERLASLDATVVDISPGGVCMRIAMDDEALEVMEQVGEGLYVEVDVAPSELRRYTVLGRVAWLWVPSMKGDDQIGSLGVDIKGVAEEDQTWLGKMRRLFSREDEVAVDRTSRIIRTRTARLPTAQEEEEEGAEPEAESESEADAKAEPEPETEADSEAEAKAEPEAESEADSEEEADADSDSGEKAESKEEKK